MASTATTAARAQRASEHNSQLAVSAVFFIAAGLLGLASLTMATLYGAARGTDPASTAIWSAVGLAAGLIALVTPSEAGRAITSRCAGRAGLCILAFVLTAGWTIAGALGNASAGRAVAVKVEQQADGARERALAEHRRAAAELDRLPAARPAAELRTLMVPLDARIGVADCGGWVQSKDARAACASRHALAVELARAERRAERELQVARSSAALDAPVSERPANSDAASIARYLGAVGVDVTAEAVADWLTILAVGVVEIGAGLALALARGAGRPVQPAATPVAEPNWNAAQRGPGETGAVPPEAPCVPAVPPAPNAPVPPAEHAAPGPAGRPCNPMFAKPEHAERTDRNAAIIERLKTGPIVGAQRDIARALGIPLTSLRNTVERDRRLRLSAGREGSRLELIG